MGSAQVLDSGLHHKTNKVKAVLPTNSKNKIVIIMGISRQLKISSDTILPMDRAKRLTRKASRTDSGIGTPSKSRGSIPKTRTSTKLRSKHLIRNLKTKNSLNRIITISIPIQEHSMRNKKIDISSKTMLGLMMSIISNIKLLKNRLFTGIFTRITTTNTGISALNIRRPVRRILKEGVLLPLKPTGRNLKRTGLMKSQSQMSIRNTSPVPTVLSMKGTEDMPRKTLPKVFG